jgi:PhnB protein
MNQIIPYLTFPGNCRQAMIFYRDCLGGDLFFQTVRDSPASDNLSGSMQDCIVHATLSIGTVIINGSDMVGDNGLIRGNAVSMLINCSSEHEIRELFKNLSAGGCASHPLETTHWGALFGGLTDRYKNCWLLNYSGK